MINRLTVTILGVVVCVALTSAMAPSTDSAFQKSAVVKVFVKGSGSGMSDIVQAVGREWNRKRDSVELVKREADAALIVTIGSRREGEHLAITLTAKFGGRSEAFSGDDVGFLIPRSSRGYVFARSPEVKGDQFGGDDIGFLVSKVEAWLVQNRARVVTSR